MKQVCVIGSGVAGILAARYLREKFTVTVYEASSSIGGVWLYNKEDDANKHTPMYKNLRTNLPKQLMTFRDLPHEQDASTFQTHGQVMQYLDKYCDMFSLKDLIQFDTKVESVKPDMSYDPVKWIVKTSNGITKLYDAVAVCTGRYDTPHIPSIPGADTFTGRIIHSREYSDPAGFTGQHVLVVGAHASGTDLVIDLCEHGVRTDVSHRREAPKEGLPDSVTQFSEPVQFLGDQVYFKGNERGYKFDTVIFATGYDTNLGYLHPDCLILTDTIPRPLYKMFINARYPTMAIFNQACFVAPFPYTEYQVVYYREFLLGNLTLPECEERLREANKLLSRVPDKPLKYQYSLHLEQFALNKDLAAATSTPCLKEHDMDSLCELYDRVGKDRAINPSLYRNKEYEYCEVTNTFRLSRDWNIK